MSDWSTYHRTETERQTLQNPWSSYSLSGRHTLYSQLLHFEHLWGFNSFTVVFLISIFRLSTLVEPVKSCRYPFWRTGLCKAKIAIWLKTDGTGNTVGYKPTPVLWSNISRLTTAFYNSRLINRLTVVNVFNYNHCSQVASICYVIVGTRLVTVSNYQASWKQSRARDCIVCLVSGRKYETVSKLLTVAEIVHTKSFEYWLVVFF